MTKRRVGGRVAVLAALPAKGDGRSGALVALLPPLLLAVTTSLALAQLIDKTRGRSRILSFVEAAHMRRELLDLVTDGYARVLRRRAGR